MSITEGAEGRPEVSSRTVVARGWFCPDSGPPTTRQ